MNKIPFDTLVFDFLRQHARGIKNAKTISFISSQMGFQRRTTERRISVLRDRGVPVLSNCNAKEGPLGIFLARSSSQVERWENQMHSRISRVSHHRKKVSGIFYQRTQHSLRLFP